MNTIHLNKIIAIADVKTRAFCGKNCIIMPIFSVLFTLMFRFLYQYVMGDGKLTPQLGAYVLIYGTGSKYRRSSLLYQLPFS